MTERDNETRPAGPTAGRNDPQDAALARESGVDKRSEPDSAPARATPVEYFVGGLVVLAMILAILMASGSIG